MYRVQSSFEILRLFCTRKKINNYFNKIHKKRISQRSKIFDSRIIFTKMTANSLCIMSFLILQLASFCMIQIETNDYLHIEFT